MYNINDVKDCANYFNVEFINKIYEIQTESGKIIVIKSEGRQFPHLVGIKRADYLRNGYRNATDLFNDILNPNAIHFNNRIIPNSIPDSSLKGRKIKNFIKMHTLFTNLNTLCIKYDPSSSSTKLNSVDYLFSNFKTGLSLGCKYENILNAFVLTSWIDETEGTKEAKEKYYSYQTMDLIKSVKIYNTNGVLLKEYIAKRNLFNYLSIFRSLNRNSMKLKKPLKFKKRIKLLSKIPFFKCKIEL